ncbi:hypothetical protein AALP_AA6G259900 [Arabis alpina]|uniref:Uncharacterized protein n=1 Tax=Arabis alpina TaxID=50452 RepID=A0A087GRR5_ARAAL|nr:hypothetical protein AALP_AA6G259900 [Arabis alpina]
MISSILLVTRLGWHSLSSSRAEMALIAGFPSKDDNLEDRFFFVEISERTVEADCIDLVKTRWERRVKPSLHEVSQEFVTAMHTELSSGNGKARMSSLGEAALEAAEKAKGSSGTNTPRAVTPMISTSMPPLVRARSSRPLVPKTVLPPPFSAEVAEFCRLSAERTRIFSCKGKGVIRETPLKRQRVDIYHAAVVSRETSASHVGVSFVGGLLRKEAYSAMKSKFSKLSLFFDHLVGDYDEDVCSMDSAFSAANEANAALQSRLDKFAEGNEILERDSLCMQKLKKDYDDKLTKLKLRCTKAKAEVSSASDLQCSKIEIGGKVQNDMLNLAEIDMNLEFIGLLLGSEPLDLLIEVKALCERRHPIYDAHDVFADLLASVQRVLEIHVVYANTIKTSVDVDDDVEVTDEDDVEGTDDDEDAED